MNNLEKRKFLSHMNIFEQFTLELENKEKKPKNKPKLMYQNVFFITYCTSLHWNRLGLTPGEIQKRLRLWWNECKFIVRFKCVCVSSRQSSQILLEMSSACIKCRNAVAKNKVGAKRSVNVMVTSSGSGFVQRNCTNTSCLQVLCIERLLMH